MIDQNIKKFSGEGLENAETADRTQRLIRRTINYYG